MAELSNRVMDSQRTEARVSISCSSSVQFLLTNYTPPIAPFREAGEDPLTMRPKIFALLGCTAISCGACCVLLAGSSLSRPMPARIGPPPPDLRAEVVAIPSRSGSVLAGWLCLADQPRGSVVLMHGVRSNRLSMVERARFFREQGYDVLLFDFQAHGESPGEH